MTSRLARPIAILLTVFFPATASAHTGVSDASGVLHGFAHPISGLDHVLAMVMVGVIAYHLGRRALWAVPFAFVSFMIFGGWVGMVRAPLPSVETVVALSVVVLGSIVAFRAPLSSVVAVATVGLFAVFHGYAHGHEMPEDAGGFLYAAGFAIATASLHMMGILAGAAIERLGAQHAAIFFRSAGAFVALIGFGMTTGLI